MTVLGIRTDKPQAELYLYKDKEQIVEMKWQAHRELSKTIHSKIQGILKQASISLEDIEGIVCFKGPGSFTGLRIGLTAANALAYAQNIPIVARRGENWLETGIKNLQAGKNEKITTPFYNRPAATSAQKS